MKKIISGLMMLIILMTTMCIYVAASAIDEYDYEINGTEYTIQIDNSIPSEKQENIALTLIGEKDFSVQTYGLGCTLFGHDYKYTTASVIEHKAATYVPRCKKQTYNVTYCDDCEYTEQTLIAVNYIACCPED